MFVSIGRGFQACRPNLFPVAQQIQLERLGYDKPVEVADFTLLFEDWSLTSVYLGRVRRPPTCSTCCASTTTPPSPGGATPMRCTTRMPTVSRRCWRRRG